MSQPWTPPPGGWQPPGPAGYGYGPGPGYGPGAGYGPGWGPAPPQPYSLRGLAVAITALLGLSMLLAGVGAIALFKLAGEIDESGTFNERRDAEDLAFAMLGLLALAYIAILSCWIVWQFRHARNAELLGRRDGLGPAWAIAGWFVPFGAIVLVPMQLLQSARASDQRGQPAAGPTVAVVVWWALLLLATTLAAVGVGIATPDEFGRIDPADEVRGHRLAGYGLVIGVVAAAAGAAVVRILSDRQAQAIDRGLPPPTPMAPPGSFGVGAPPPGWGPPPGWAPPSGWAPPADRGQPPPGARCASA